MLRVTTLFAASAAATAAYYAKYLTAAPGEEPGLWCGLQADCLGLSGRVQAEDLELLLSGRDPVSGTRLGSPLLDRFTSSGKLRRAVAGFDATFSAPKSLSVWWALTGDERLLDAHDVAVGAALDHLEQYGSTTRVRRNGRMAHPDTGGLTMATFRQTTSRADDPQVHTHAVISTKVQTDDGRWYALDARYLKRHQRMLGGVYQSVLRAELSQRFGVAWEPIVDGQAEIAGVPTELLGAFSKRTTIIDAALQVKVDEFRLREGRDPSRWERAAMTREASADTRRRKSGVGVADLTTRWAAEAAAVGWSGNTLRQAIDDAAHDAQVRTPDGLTVGETVEAVSVRRSTWCRAHVVQELCDRMRPASPMGGRRWLDLIEQATDRVTARCVDLDPPDPTECRASDGRSIWLEPTAARFTSDDVLAQEERIVTWAMSAQVTPPAPSLTARLPGLDVWQGDATAAVAGQDRLVLVIGPAGAGKTRTLAAAALDLAVQGRVVFGLAPSAKAARVLQRETGMPADTVAKLLHEWHRRDRPPDPDQRLPAETTVVADEASMISTPDLHDLVRLADANQWRLVLVGDHRQLQAVGRGGLFAELCATGRVHELEQLHRFTHSWEAAASLQLRHGDQRALDAYEEHGRIVAGTLEEHVERMAHACIDHHRRGDTIALVATTNDQVDAINRHVQAVRRAQRQIDPDRAVRIGGGERAHVGDVVATRRNDRRLTTTTGQPVRNREIWTIGRVHNDGSLTVTHQQGHGRVVLPADYVQNHVRLGYAATEHGYQSDTVTAAIALISPVTTRRGLYVAATRGRDRNELCVITDSNDVAEARDVLDAVLAVDRADIPAVTQRRTLAATDQRPPQEATVTAPRPICSVPEWFGEVRRQVQVQLQRAEQQAEAIADRQRQRQLARDELVNEIIVAKREAEPHQTAIDDAQRAVDAFRRRLAAAAKELDRAGLRRRHAQRQALASAEDRLAAATQRLRQITTAADPHLQRTRAAVTELRDHDRDSGALQVTGCWTNGAARLPQLRAVGNALDTWHTWANGQPVTTEQRHRMTATLEVASIGPADPFLHALAQSVRNWTATNGVEPSPCTPPAIQPPTPSIGLHL